MEHLASDRVEIDAAVDMRVVSKDCGFYFNGVISAAVTMFLRKLSWAQLTTAAACHRCSCCAPCPAASRRPK
jgi:hypothetical protein